MSTPTIGSIHSYESTNAAPVDSGNNLSSTTRYESMLRDSINHFLAELSNGSSDFSVFQSIFVRLVDSISDPPLEFIWFYSATTFHSFPASPDDPAKKLLVAKDLFQLLVSCSNPCNALKKVAVLSPVVYVLYYLVVDHSKRDLLSRKEIEDFVERIVSYICMCSSRYLEELDDGLDNLMECFPELIRVWTADHVVENCKFKNSLSAFFPLLNDDLRLGINAGSSIGYLAGVVMNQIFLLRLCLKFGFGISSEVLQTDAGDWAVQTIKGFQNYYFFDMLLKMLLDQSLPVTTLLNPEEMVLVQKMVFDAVILGDPSSLNCTKLASLPDKHLKDLALTWLLVVDTAMEFVSGTHDQTSAISYVNAYAKSHLCGRLINETSMQEETIYRPNISTPRSLIKWLLVLEEEQGLTIFDHHILKSHAKRVISKSNLDCFLHESKPNGRENLDCCKGCKENKVVGDEDMVDSLTAPECGRKRKDWIRRDGKTPPVKLLKYKVDDNSSMWDSSFEGLSRRTEVDSTISDEYMEETS